VTVERLLQINVAVLAVLATVLLGLGQANAYLPLVALFAATVSLVFTDTFGWFRLNRSVANLFALVAAVYSLSSFIRFDKEQQLLSIANLLVYLQFILLFQHKSPRVYWQLMVLGLLQVVVAVALSLDAMSSVLIVAYMVAGVSALTLFFLHRESLRVTRKLPRTILTMRGSRTKPQKRVSPSELLTKPQAVFDANPNALAKRVLGGRLIRQIAAMSALSLLFATVLFYTVPRHGDSIWQGPGSRRSAKVGFSGMQGISFEEEGLIEENNDPVLRVAFRDHKTGKRYTVVGRPYLRGTVLMHYSASENRWWQRVHPHSPTGARELHSPPANAELVRQEVVMEPSDGKFLFSVYPWWRYERHDERRDKRYESGIAYDNVNQKLSIPRRGLNHDGGPLRYTLLTDAFRSGWQLRATPFLHDPHRQSSRRMSDRSRGHLTDMNVDTRPHRRENMLDMMRFPQLRVEAKRIIDAAPEVDPGNHLQVAKALEDHFRASGQYTYSLDFRNIKRDPNLDPMEDFVANHRSGHCEYFAGALALMLRSQKIPARIVVGFAGGEYNPMGGFYQVRAKDAHAWVEAYIEPEHFDEEMPLPDGANIAGVWYRLDPTPAADGEESDLAGDFSVMRKVDQFLDYFRFVWADYVIGLDKERQQQAVYGNLPDEQPDAFGGEQLRSWMDRTARNLGIAGTGENGKLKIRWTVVAGVLAGLVLLAFMIRRLSRSDARAGRKSLLRRLVSRMVATVLPQAAGLSDAQAQRTRRNAAQLEFYARLARLVAPLGLVRKEGQTQQEFAEMVRSRLVQLQQSDSIAALPVKIVEVFYRIRFGGAALDTQEQENVEQALSKLEEALNV